MGTMCDPLTFCNQNMWGAERKTFLQTQTGMYVTGVLSKLNISEGNFIPKWNILQAKAELSNDSEASGTLYISKST